MVVPSLNINTITEVKAGPNFVHNDVCKYLVDWPVGATYKDELIFDVNVLTRVKLYLTASTSYSGENATEIYFVKGSRIKVDYPNKIFVTYVSTEWFDGDFNFWVFFSKGTGNDLTPPPPSPAPPKEEV